jgi:hypothetical protein
MLRKCSLVTGFSLVFVGLFAFGQDQTRPAEWKVDPVALKKLGDSVEVGGFSLQVPRGYTSHETSVESAIGPMKVFAFVGPLRKDKTRSTTTMIITNLTPAFQENYREKSLEQIAVKKLESVKTGKKNWKQEKAELGTINGRAFVRIRWSGTDPDKKGDMRGFFYFTKDEKTTLQFNCEDLVSFGTDGLKLAEAAALTLQKPVQDQLVALGGNADPAVVKKLGSAVVVEGYSIQIPKGFQKMQAPNAPGPMKMAGWIGPERRDKTRPSLTMNVMTLPPGEVEKMKGMSLEQLSERLIQGVKRIRTNWKQEQPEKSTINGIEFVRINWSGTNTENNREMRGFAYVARDGDKILQISSQDIVPDGEKELPIAEAAILSFKKK